MSARKTWLLWGMLALILTACAGSSLASTAIPPTSPAVQTVTPAMKTDTRSFWRKSQEGTVIVELQPINLAKPEDAPKGQWVFQVKLNQSGMDGPPLTKVYDLARLAYLMGPNGEQISPISWSVEDEGHMGHHVKGTLTFPEEAQLQTIRVVIAEVGGVSERIFEWPVAP